LLDPFGHFFSNIIILTARQTCADFQGADADHALVPDQNSVHAGLASFPPHPGLLLQILYGLV
jgi:hypothetical protein